ncbi:MAG: hypothetical protein EBX40_08925 [Gammaproteobacteria bacterium]|nr:hypothetical protein [Gammaproteobacteria bacterium]
MVIDSLIGYLAPKITQYLFEHLAEWAEPVAKGVGCKVLNFAGEKYAAQRADIDRWVRNIVPGERFDDLAARLIDQLIIFSMQEIAEFIECEIKLHGLNAVDALERAAESGQVPAIFERIANKVVFDTKSFRQTLQ